MITRLRKIRRQLITEGNIIRYLLYAVGEIALVMIGILLALYVNNQNEERKQGLKSAEILLEIKENLESNSIQFQQEIDMEKKVIASIDIVLHNVTASRIYRDTMDKHFHLCAYWPTSNWKTSGYEALKSQGVELVQSKALRESIIGLYEISYPEISELIRNSEGYSYSTSIPILSELFAFASTLVDQPIETYEAKPFDYNQVLQSKKLKGILGFWRLMRVVGIQARRNAIKKNEEIINLIDRSSIVRKT